MLTRGVVSLISMGLAMSLSLLLGVPGIGERLENPQAVAFSPDGNFLAVGDAGKKRVLIYRRGEKNWQRTISINDIDEPYGLVWWKDKLFVSEGGKGQIQVFRIGERKARKEATITDLRFPAGLDIWKDRLFVTEAEGNCVAVVDLSKYPSIPTSFYRFGKQGDEKGELNHPMDVAVGDDGKVFVANEGNGRLVVWLYDASTNTAQPYEPYVLREFWTCRSVAFFPPTQEIWVLSSLGGEVWWANTSDLTNPNWRSLSPFAEGIPQEVAGVYSGQRTPQGTPSKHSIFKEGMVPPVLALGRLGHYTRPIHDFALPRIAGGTSTQGKEVAIACHDRVILLPFVPSASRSRFQIPTRPRISYSQNTVNISWESPIPGETKVEIRPVKSPDGEWKIFSRAGTRTKHNIKVKGLQPATAYLLRIPLPNCQEITDDTLSHPLYSFEFQFASPPKKGETMFLRIPVAVLVYADVINMDSVPKDSPPAPPVSRAYLDYIRREVEMAQLFYWCNSHMKVWIDCDWFFVTKRLLTGKDQPFFTDGNGASREEALRDLEELLKLRGRSLKEYPAVVVITCTRHWDAERKEYRFTPSGGGTYGVDANPGSSHFLGGHDPAWLFVHEFHHQLDSQYWESGYPEYPFNHFSLTPSEFAENFNSHYDGNAWILRHWHYGDLLLWFTNKFGEVVTAKDEDEDGIPDDCPAVPLDEKRFGSDPRKKDTDGDGLDDLEEVMASSWVFEDLVWPDDINSRARYLLPNPNNPDTDGDGLRDSIDPYPLYACGTLIGRDPNMRWFWLDEDTSEEARPYPLPPIAQPLHSDIYLYHDDEYLYFRFLLSLPAPVVGIQLDCNADGWFVGTDNLYIEARMDWKKEKLEARLDAWVHNQGSVEKYPFVDRSLFPKDNAKVECRALGNGKYEVLISLKRTPEIGLVLTPGKKIQLAIKMLAEEGSPRWLWVFQPYQFVALEVE